MAHSASKLQQLLTTLNSAVQLPIYMYNAFIFKENCCLHVGTIISIHSWFVFKVFATLMLVGVSYFYKYYDMLENYVQYSVMVYMYALRISFLPFQYVIDIEYSGVECSVYRSYFSHGNKENNYTLLVRKDNAKPVVLHFVGFDRLFGSHYDEYDIVYTDFVSSAPDPSVFDYQTSKYYRCTHSYVYDKPSICTCCKWFRLRS